MAQIMDFSRYAQAPDTDAMSRTELLEYLEAVRAQLGSLDGQEPADMDGEAFEAWAQRHEELEDLVDDILDRLDEMEDSRS